jgi:hypothetical protein
MDGKLTFLQLCNGGVEELTVLTVHIQVRPQKVQIPCKSSTHIAIRLGALGILGALFVLGCPARSVSLK